MIAKYFATVVGDRERGQRAAGHQQLPYRSRTTSISLVGLESRSTMFAGLARRLVPVFMATPTSACASAGASLVHVAAHRHPACPWPARRE